MMRSMNEDAFTGLEAAIVLIAFVVVAAVFSYVVLGAGFFTTQKSQETVHSGVAMASSAVEILGDVYGNGDTATPPTKVASIQFTLGLAAGATAVDMSKAALVLSTGAAVNTLAHKTNGTDPGPGEWNVTERLYELGTTNMMLEKGEQFVVKAVPPATITLSPYTAFNLEVRPPVGAALGIKRTVPAYITPVNLLY